MQYCMAVATRLVGFVVDTLFVVMIAFVVGLVIVIVVVVVVVVVVPVIICFVIFAAFDIVAFVVVVVAVAVVAVIVAAVIVVVVDIVDNFDIEVLAHALHFHFHLHISYILAVEVLDSRSWNTCSSPSRFRSSSPSGWQHPAKSKCSSAVLQSHRQSRVLRSRTPKAHSVLALLVLPGVATPFVCMAARSVRTEDVPARSSSAAGTSAWSTS